MNPRTDDASEHADTHARMHGTKAVIKSMERDAATNRTKVVCILPSGEEKTVYISLKVDGVGRITPNLKQFGTHEAAMARLFAHAVSSGYRYPTPLSFKRIKKIARVQDSGALRRLLAVAVEKNVLEKKKRQALMKRALYFVPRRYLRRPRNAP